jgi:hypothetical protein
MTPSPPLYVPISCPSGKHSRSIVAFRDHTVATLFCLPCERAWSVETSHAALADLPVTDIVDSSRRGE